MFALAIVLQHLLPDTALATYTYILVMYHLVLAFKIMTADKKAGLSLPVPFSIVTHLACLGLVIGIAVARHQIPFFGIIRYFIPGIAPFEAKWLFNGEKAVPIHDSETAPVAAPTLEAVPVAQTATPSHYDSCSGEDYEEFLKLMQQGKRPFRKPGRTVRQEFEAWLASRPKARAPEAEAPATAEQQTA
jgi:hypothetical protein